MSPEDRATAPAIEAFLVADLLLRGNAWQLGWVLEDGTVLIVDERMPRGFIAAGTGTGDIVVGQIGEKPHSHDT